MLQEAEGIRGSRRRARRANFGAAKMRKTTRERIQKMLEEEEEDNTKKDFSANEGTDQAARTA